MGHPVLLTLRPGVPLGDTGFPSFSHISVGLGVPVALQVRRKGVPSSTGPGRLGGRVIRGGTAKMGGREERSVSPTASDTGWLPSGMQVTDKSMGVTFQSKQPGRDCVNTRGFY